MISRTKTAKAAGRKATRAARQAVETVSAAELADTGAAPEALASSPAEAVIAPAASSRSSRPKASSKLGIVLGLLEQPAGASLSRLVELTGWLPHTTRAALTGLRKRGFPVVLETGSGDNGSVYRIRTDAA